MGDVILRPDRELHASRQLEEGNRAVLELAADDAFGRQPETVTIKRDGLLEIGHTEREDRNTGLHRKSPA
jgi:hypothetical protein